MNFFFRKYLILQRGCRSCSELAGVQSTDWALLPAALGEKHCWNLMHMRHVGRLSSLGRGTLYRGCHMVLVCSATCGDISLRWNG